ncbi:MAG TPA: PDDEXK nuclease domain-containing protein [Gammaproteobacteria bacterium]|nr:PDDEXK nuclease domain-containing protein [Gammaproteobacteria bacterium]
MSNKKKIPIKSVKSLVSKPIEVSSTKVDEICNRIINRVYAARQNISRTVDTEIVKNYWMIGKEIVEEELAGKKRATYGAQLLKMVSEQLTQKLGRGYTVSNLGHMKQFYITYQEIISIRHAVSGELAFNNVDIPLSWTHYRLLIKVDRKEARDFYEKEAVENRWSSRELGRQIGSLLFDRLAKSRDKKGLMRLAKKGQEIQSPEDAIKEPVVLEFLNLPESHRLVESKLEEALINNLQHFLLEMGKGFAFIGRQQRLTLDSDHFYADLVMYHTILKCFVIIDLKTKPLSHADLGQMQLYVNYFDQECRSEGDNPTIGLILCTQKNDAMVKYTLGKKGRKIFANKYQFHLPTEAELEAEIKRELKEIRHFK